MDACHTQSAPVAEPFAISARQWLRYAPAAVIAVGLAWRLVRYLGQFPIWGDEAMLLLNILDRDYAELTQHLRFCQVAPLLFLWAERTALLLFGSSELSMHLFPLSMGLIAFVMFRRTCQASFTPAVAGLAVGILAVSYYPVRHGCEVKPYAFDLCFAVLYLWLALARLRNPAQARWLLGLVLATPIAVFSSYPSVFVGGAVSLVLMPGLRSASWTQRGLYVLFNVLLVGSFVVHYTLVGQHGPDAAEAMRAREFLHNYWRDAFPPESVLQWPLWLAQVFTGNMLAYPLGANRGGSVVTFLCVLLGSFSLWRTQQREILAALLAAVRSQSARRDPRQVSVRRQCSHHAASGAIHLRGDGARHRPDPRLGALTGGAAPLAVGGLRLVAGLRHRRPCARRFAPL